MAQNEKINGGILGLIWRPIYHGPIIQIESVPKIIFREFPFLLSTARARVLVCVTMLRLLSCKLCERMNGGINIRPLSCAQSSGFHSSQPYFAPRSFFGVEDFLDDDNSRPYTYQKEKKSKNPNKHVSFKQRTVAYMEPFTLDVFISKRFVSASITHRVTSKQVAVAGTNSKDIKAVLKSRSDIPACLAVGQILADRAREADVYTASYTPRERDKFEGKIRAVVQSLIDNGIDVKVFLD
ncbi:Ribosomal L18p/L5e family protein [Abeliophyllum distichum]|uniref:Ribosomal L18p/L5e family protein n=1 Tax=Abeliophyllum distichum TaxID=126358 RepID=A0ABD1QWI4_9LAMI